MLNMLKSIPGTKPVLRNDSNVSGTREQSEPITGFKLKPRVHWLQVRGANHCKNTVAIYANSELVQTSTVLFISIC